MRRLSTENPQTTKTMKPSERMSEGLPNSQHGLVRTMSCVGRAAFRVGSAACHVQALYRRIRLASSRLVTLPAPCARYRVVRFPPMHLVQRQDADVLQRFPGDGVPLAVQDKKQRTVVRSDFVDGHLDAGSDAVLLQV